MTSTTSAAASASSSAASTISIPSNLKVRTSLFYFPNLLCLTCLIIGLQVVGIILAIASGLLIGSSFVFKKKGLLRSQVDSGAVAGEGVAYLKSVCAAEFCASSLLSHISFLAIMVDRHVELRSRFHDARILGANSHGLQ